MSKLKVLFKQVSGHLPHEANVEQYFSRAGFLSDPNIDPAYLGILTMIGVNAQRFKPSVAAVKEKYYTKFRMHGTEPAFASQSDGAEP